LAQQIGRSEGPLSEEDRYRLLVEAVTDYAIYMLTRMGSSRAGIQEHVVSRGYEASEIIGQHFSRFYTEEDRVAGLPGRALQTAADEGRFEIEGWRVRKDGTRFWTQVIIDAIRSPSGELLGFAKITRDLTERKRAEALLRRTEEQFKLLVQGVTDYAIYMLDTEWAGRELECRGAADQGLPSGRDHRRALLAVLHR
jgi:PAS domain S-box-containing protein